MLRCNAYGETTLVRPFRTTYTHTKTLAIELISEFEESYAVITVDLSDCLQGLGLTLPVNCQFVDVSKAWVEEFIKTNELGKPTGITVQKEGITYPLYRFDLNKLTDD